MPQNPNATAQTGGIPGGYIQVTTKQPRMFCIVDGVPWPSFSALVAQLASSSFLLSPCLRHRQVEPLAFVQLLPRRFLSLSLSLFFPLRIGARGDKTQRQTGSGDVGEGQAWWRVERGREWLVLLFPACG